MKKVIYIIFLVVFQVVFAQEKPNILIIHTDDLGCHDLSISGSELYNTPHIDALAQEGVSFSNAYSSYPRCTPSRYGMMTATYPVNENKGHLGAIKESHNYIKQFTKAGYNAYYIGKWHLGKGDSTPKGFGFTSSYAAGEAGGIASRHYPFNTKRNGKPGKYLVPDVQEDGKEGDYASDLLTDATIKFMEQTPKDKPFLAVVAYYAVHTPIEAKKVDEDRNIEQLKTIHFGNAPEYIVEGEGRTKMLQDSPAYAGMVENVDENVGRLLHSLKSMGISDNTIVVFSSDHGGLSNDGNKGERILATSNFPLRAGKGWLYEGGIRVPLFIKWPKKLTPRVDTESIVLGMDVFPTLLDLAADKTLLGLDGKSYKQVLFGNEQWKDRTVFWHSRKARPHSTGDIKTSAVRSGDYKLLHFYEKDVLELYNLKDDISEIYDMSKIYPQKTAKLLATLNQWKSDYLIPSKMDVLKPRSGKKSKKKGAENKRKKKFN